MIIHRGDEQEIMHVVSHACVHDDLADEAQYRAKLRKVTKIKLTNECQHSWVEWERSFYDAEFFKKIYREGYKMVCFWFDGSWPDAPEFETELLRLYHREWNDVNWMVSGNIIYRDWRPWYPKWHHQCVILNLKKWIEEGCPNLNRIDNRNNRKPGFKVSPEHYHDNYTPMWLKPDRDLNHTPEMETMKMDLKNLDWMIPNAINANCMVINHPESLRKHKRCIYAEENIEQTKNWIMDTEFNETRTPREIVEFGYDLDEDKMELYGFKIQQYQVLYVTNTERVPSRGEHLDEIGFTKMVMPCSGLNQFWHISKDLNTMEEVLWFDFNPYAIAWTKLVLHEWEPGVQSFTEFYRNNIDRVIGDGIISPDCVIYEDYLVERLIEAMGGEEEFTAKMWQIKQLKHTFLQVNAVKQWKTLADAVGMGNRIFLQLTNVWQYESNYLNTRPFEAQINFLSLLSQIQQNNPVVYLTGNTPGGVQCSYTDINSMVDLY